MVCVLSRLISRRTLLHQPIRTFARTAARKTKSKTGDNGSSPVRQTVKQAVFCFGAVGFVVYTTATAEANRVIHGWGLRTGEWKIWDKIKSWSGIDRLPQSQLHSTLSTGVVQFITLNCAVFLVLPLLLIKRSHLFLHYFTSSANTAAISPLTSMFVHGSFFHLLANMLGLYAVTVGWHGKGPPVRGSLRDMTYYQLVCLLLSAGMCTALASSLRGLLTGSMVNAVGFSNALYALLFYELYTVPDARVGIVLINRNFSAEELSHLIVGLELLLLVFSRYHRMDNLGHLVGAAFGYWYALKGCKMWREFRDMQVEWFYQNR